MMPRIVMEGRFDDRCGHNFPPMECPYERCGYRDALERIRVVEADMEAAKILLSLDKGASLGDGVARLILENDRFREELARNKKIEETLRAHLDHLSSFWIQNQIDLLRQSCGGERRNDAPILVDSRLALDRDLAMRR